MDLETENHLAALLVEEARRLRREAEKDGVHVYLQKPNVRGRPNSRFLTATVLGVEQANRAAEISEMWRAREKERELDAKQRHGSKDNRTGMHVRNGCLHENSKPLLEENSALVTSLDKYRKINSPSEGSQTRHENDQRDHSRHCSSSKPYSEESHSRGFVGLHDDDIEEFLHSRVKRGRGSVGCRMDEPGPYLPSTSADLDEPSASPAKRAGEERKRRILVGPEKPHFLKSNPAHIGVGYSMRQATDECKSEKDPYDEKRKSKREKSESKRRKEKSKNQKKHRRRDSVKIKAKYV
ncbi:hypothetical protein KFK09_011139 [Dendrobium nobile]|uniref:Uncharacterized protein n=1 Tax=Dendrobium nobile TaxID=94219 RepID=A0A8T3BF41_DENNO|nr:hypothetical protein KFK09_011139 [Dendrobium nobile]